MNKYEDSERPSDTNVSRDLSSEKTGTKRILKQLSAVCHGDTVVYNLNTVKSGGG